MKRSIKRPRIQTSRVDDLSSGAFVSMGASVSVGSVYATTYRCRRRRGAEELLWSKGLVLVMRAGYAPMWWRLAMEGEGNRARRVWHRARSCNEACCPAPHHTEAITRLLRSDGQNARPAHGPRRRTDGRLAGPSPRGPAAQGLCPKLTPQSDGDTPCAHPAGGACVRRDGSSCLRSLSLSDIGLPRIAAQKPAVSISSSRKQPSAYSTAPVVNAGQMHSMLRCRTIGPQ